MSQTPKQQESKKMETTSHTDKNHKRFRNFFSSVSNIMVHETAYNTEEGREVLARLSDASAKYTT